MSDFQELIKNIDKCRDYVRDFFVYGFKSRSDFPGKSARTYDDERRRIVSWLPEYVQEDYTEGGRSKNISLQIDQKKLHTNPLFRVWQTKSFTDKDLSLHFFLIKLLEDPEAAYSAAELTDLLMDEYGYEADLQSVRRKCNEYVEEGLFTMRKEGKSVLYSRGVLFEELPYSGKLLELIRCFQMDQPLGVAGDTILSGQDTENDIFRVKHGFPTFTLEDEILLQLLSAIHEQKKAELLVQNNRRLQGEGSRRCGYPLQIFVSTRTGRRFVCMDMVTIRKEQKSMPDRKQSGRKTEYFACFRLDQIKEVALLSEIDERREERLKRLAVEREKVWGVSFAPLVPGRGLFQKVVLTLQIHEKTEPYILNRLMREGKGGSVERIGQDTFRYEKTVKDAMEMFPWIRSFTGRIKELSIYGTDGEQIFEENKKLEEIFRADLKRMYEMYGI